MVEIEVEAAADADVVAAGCCCCCACRTMCPILPASNIIHLNVNSIVFLMAHSTQHIGAMKACIQLPKHKEISMTLPGGQYVRHLDGHQSSMASVSL